MKGFTFGAAAAVSTLFVNGVLAAVDPIVIKGSKFFYKTNGTQFYIRGIGYQQDFQSSAVSDSSSSINYKDPLADTSACKRDIPYLLQLRTNTIRVYAIDPTQNHDGCMNALADAGIYVISDLSDPADSINRNSPSWNDALYTRYSSVVDALAPYSNTLGFFAGNEVSNQYNNTAASAFVKAAVRDMKSYIQAKNYRTIGVGYASDDDANIRDNESNYMNCGDASNSIDFWGYNIYEWCGQSTFQQSGYAARTAAFANYSVPVFFAEYGCITPNRTFGDTPVLYGPDMENVWSGGIVYMYFQESNGYGLVSLSGSSIQTLSDFNVLSTQIASVSPTGTQMSAYTPSNSPRACPTTNAQWAAVASPLPPTPNQQLCQCMYNSLSCVVKGSVAASQYGTLFGTVCGLDSTACGGINTNSTNGPFGAYSMCNATEQLAFAFNAYYADQGSSPSACDFGGAATLKSSTSPTGSCATLYSQAGGAQGTGTVTQQPNVSGGSGSGSTSKSGSGASGRMAGSPVSGLWQMTSFFVIAGVSGLGMILL